MKAIAAVAVCLLASVTAFAANTARVIPVTSPDEVSAMLEATALAEGEQLKLTLTLAPGSANRGEFQGYSFRVTSTPIDAAQLDVVYWQTARRTEASSARTLRVSLRRDEVENSFVALKFWHAKGEAGDIEVCCIPATLLERLARASGPAVHATPPADDPFIRWLEAFTPVIELPRW